MSDFFDYLERDLGVAVERGAHLPWYTRARRRLNGWSWRGRALAVLVAVSLVAGPALAAAGVFGSGSPVPPIGRPVASVGNGIAIRGGVELLGLRVPDPAGGPPWGLRLIHTTRGLVCLAVGRAFEGRIGALGRDGAFGNDDLFHPFTANYFNGPPQCASPDARGDAFQAVAWYGVPASALSPGGCAPPAPVLPPRIVRIRHRLHLPAQPHPHGSGPCPAGDLRDIYYGLLGPDATEVAYRTRNGKIRTERTFGTVGAYLVVERHSATQSGSIGFTSSPTSDTAIRGVAWRTGDNCGVLSAQNRGIPVTGCRIHGYHPPKTRIPTVAAVRAPVTVKLVNATHYCSNERTIVACDRAVPHGYFRIPASAAQHSKPLAIIQFTAKVAVTNGRNAYTIYITRGNHECAEDITRNNLQAAQRVTQTIFVGANCHGIEHGTVNLMTATGPNTSPILLMRPHPHISVSRLVGRFSLRVP